DIYDHYQKKFQPFPRKEVTIKFGEPVDLSSYRGKGKEEDKGTLQEVTRLLMLRVRELLAEIRGEQPPAEFFDPRNAKRSSDVAGAGDDTRCNPDCLPGVDLPAGLRATADAAEALRGAEAVVLAVPSQTLRENLAEWRPLLPAGATLVSLAKGVELSTLKRM